MNKVLQFRQKRKNRHRFSIAAFNSLITPSPMGEGWGEVWVRG